jgi:protein-arginine deiminase
MDLVLDAITDWGLDPYPEELLGENFGWLERGQRPATIHTDSMGNLECTPPLTVDGTEYPFGRIYYGGAPGGKRMAEGLRTFLADQEVQSPVELDVNWLVVGHVDEALTFVPDPSSEKGFKVLVADYQALMDILAGLDPRMRLPMYEMYGYATVEDILQTGTMELNADVDIQHMQPLVSVIMSEFGLEEQDLIRVPALWIGMVEGALALMPNMVNLQVFDEHLLIADPFFRAVDTQLAEEDLNENWQLDPGEDLDGDGLLTTFRDPMILYMQQSLPSGLTLHFLDNWRDYHTQGGEVHCGTNVLRTPPSDRSWWDLD